MQPNGPRYPAPTQQDGPSGPVQQQQAGKAAANQKPVDARKKIGKAVAMQSIRQSRRVGGHNLATLPLLPPSWDAAPAAPVQQNELRHPAPTKQNKPSGPDQQRKAAKAAENQTANGTCKELEKAAADRRNAEYLAFKESGVSLSGYSAPAASSRDSAPAAPVQQNDPRYPAAIKQDRHSGPDRQRKAAKAAENQKTVDACKKIEKAAADRRHAEYLAFKEGGGSSSGYAAPAAS